MSERLFYKVFALLLFIMGIVYAVVLPPFQDPDEIAHYQRAYELSQGRCRPPHDLAWPENYTHDSTIFHPFLESDEIVPDHLVLEAMREHFAFFATSDADTVKTPAPLANYENVYPCFLYAPAALALAVSAPLHPTITASLLVVRVTTVLICGSIIVFALTLVPFGKEAFALVALLPTIVQQLASSSEDGSVFAIAFIAFAYFLRLAYVRREAPLYRRDAAAIAVLCAALALAKIDALLISLLVFVPSARFGGPRRRFAALSVFALVAIVAFASSPIFAGTDWHSFTRIAATRNTDPSVNAAFALHHPRAMIAAFVATVRQTGAQLFTEMIGTFGWNAVRVPAPYAIFAALALAIAGARTVLPRGAWRLRAIFLSIVGLAVVLVFYSLYLVNETGDTLGSLANGALIYGVQGRYFLPFLPAAVFALGLAKRGERRYDRFFVLFAAIVLLTEGLRTTVGFFY